LARSGGARRDATATRAAVRDALLPRAAREAVWEDALRCAALLAVAPLRPLTTARGARPPALSGALARPAELIPTTRSLNG
jgi:hypothetical protein